MCRYFPVACNQPPPIKDKIPNGTLPISEDIDMIDISDDTYDPTNLNVSASKALPPENSDIDFQSDISDQKNKEVISF